MDSMNTMCERLECSLSAVAPTARCFIARSSSDATCTESLTAQLRAGMHSVTAPAYSTAACYAVLDEASHDDTHLVRRKGEHCTNYWHYLIRAPHVQCLYEAH